MRQHNDFVLERAGAFEEVVQVQVLVDAGAVAVLGEQEGAFDEEDARAEELRSSVEYGGAAVARVGEEGRVFPAGHLHAPRAQGGNLLSGQIEELVLQLA